MNYTKNRKIYISVSAVLLISVMVLIFCLSAQNAAESSETSGFFTAFIAFIFGKAVNEEIIRTLAHFCEFAVLGFLVNNFVFSLKEQLKPLICIALSWAYAWTDEIHQIFVDGRAFQLIDLTVDLGGIILGTAMFGCFILLFKKVKSMKKSH
ncbi:MAG: VanZ family protein [Acutalibacteraceae bacterium]